MRLKVARIAVLFLLCLPVVLSGCAGKKVRYAVPEGPGEKVVSIVADSFRFEPAEILAREGETLLLRVENVSTMGHNLTVLDPQKRSVIDLVLPAGQTVTAELSLGQPGEYRFYCDKTLHSAFGMTGHIEVGDLPGAPR